MKSYNFQWKSETLNKTEQIVTEEKPIINPITEVLVESKPEIKIEPKIEPKLEIEQIKSHKIKPHELCVCYPAKVQIISNRLSDDLDIQKKFEDKIELRIKILDLEDLFVKFYCEDTIPIYSLVCVYPKRIRRWWIVDSIENNEYLAVPSNINMKKI